MNIYENILSSISLDTAIKCLIVVENDFKDYKCYYDIKQALNHYDMNYNNENINMNEALQKLYKTDNHVLYEVEDMIIRTKNDKVNLSAF